jgi:transcriptional regulator with XRE-family HTH domain
MIATVKPQVKATFDRWLDDQLEDKGISKEQLAEAIGITPEMLTRRMNNPALFNSPEFFKLSRILNKDWYNDMICAFPDALKPLLSKISMDEAFAYAQESGEWWYKDQHAA